MKARRILLYLQDTSEQAMEEYYEYISKLPFPEGTSKGIEDAGKCSRPQIPYTIPMLS